MIYSIARSVAKQSLTGWVERWMLLLQAFEFDIHHCLGVQHVEIDYLSRLESGEPIECVNDDLQDAELFGISLSPPNPDSVQISA